MKKSFIKNNSGASNIEIIVWFTVVLVIGTALFVFKDNVVNFLNTVGAQIGKFGTTIQQQRGN